MDRMRIIEYISKNIKYTEEQKDLIDALEKAREELFRARQYFEMVTDNKLIDYAIYMEQAARSRYAYLLSIAKEKGIRVDNSFYLNETEAG